MKHVARPKPFTGPRTRRALQAQVAAWQAFLGLTEWDIRLSLATPPTEDRAHVNYDTQKFIAAVRIGRLPIEALDATIVHELAHVLFADFTSTLKGILKAHLSPTEWDVASAVLEEQQERILNRLAAIITGRPYVLETAADEDADYASYHDTFGAKRPREWR